jgi:hypothetical protein
VKYRLVKTTKASGFVLWCIQKKVLWWWEYVDSYIEESKALFVLTKLRSGAPEETREVITP